LAVPAGGGISARRYATIYVCVATPLLLALCFLSGPFQVPDEPAHFFRAVQISHGQMLPVVGPDGHSAGGLVDAPAIALVGDVMGRLKAFGAEPRAALAEILADGAREGQGPPTYTAFNNTVIYFPLVYLVPAVAITAARQAGLEPIAWLYVGRLANAGAALVVSFLSILLFEEAAVYAFVLCLLPRVLFEEASVSADALLIPFATLFWALLARLAVTGAAKRYVLPGLLLAMLYVCVGKFAYIPMAVLPPLVAAIEGRRSPRVAALAAASGLVFGCWLLWSLIVRNDVFTIGYHVGVVDAHQQLHAVLRDPAMFVEALARSFRTTEASLFLGMDGPVVGWLHNITLPAPILYLSLATLAAAAVFRRPGPMPRAATRWASAAVVLGCVVAIYFLLYLQFTPVGVARVDGMQGRYFIPLLAAVPIVLGGTPRLGRARTTVEYAAVGYSIFAGLALVAMVGRGYWLG